MRGNGAAKRAHEASNGCIVSSDPSQAMLAFRGALAAAAVPTTLVVDPEGRVPGRVVGPVSAGRVGALIESALVETDAPD